MTFEGTVWGSSKQWYEFIHLEDKPINYLEIGAAYGGTMISVSETYGAHKDSKLYCIDPWEDYGDYGEYKGQQNNVYSTFLKNIGNCKDRYKMIPIKGYSHIEIAKFPDEFFDIIYIDGNHEPDYVLEDAVLCFRKLKKGGHIIFDDYGWNGPDYVKKGVDAFIQGYHKKIKFLGEKLTQVYVQRLINPIPPITY